MAKQNFTFAQLAKLGYIEVDGKMVKADTQVAKGRVEKLQTDLYINLPDMEMSPLKLMAMFNEEGLRRNLEQTSGLYTFQLPTGEILNIRHEFKISPCPAPRMTNSDKWKTDPYHADPEKRQRKAVTKYYDWRDTFRILCAKQGYVLDEVLRVVFVMPMPKYLSRKKREMRLGQPHKQRPDTDNMIKSIKDSFNVDDGYVWDERGVKVWGEEAKILIF